jgi:hypothetical protein
MFAEGWHILPYLSFDQPGVSLGHVTGAEQVVYLADIKYYKFHDFFHAFFDLSHLTPRQKQAVFV